MNTVIYGFTSADLTAQKAVFETLGLTESEDLTGKFSDGGDYIYLVKIISKPKECKIGVLALRPDIDVWQKVFGSDGLFTFAQRMLNTDATNTARASLTDRPKTSGGKIVEKEAM